MSIFRRTGSPYYYSEVVRGDIRSVRSTKSSSRREAEAFDREHVKAVEARAGKPHKSALTLDEACGRYWIEKGQHLGWSEHVARHLKWIVAAIGHDTLLSGTNNEQGGLLVAARKRAGAGPAGVNRTLAVLRQVLGRAQKSWGLEIQHIDWRAHWQQEPKGRVRWLTQAEAQRLCEACQEHVRLAVEWSLYTGTRKSETYGLRWDDVDLERGQATVNGKTGHRIVWLSAGTRGVLAKCSHARPFVFDQRNQRKHFTAALKAAHISNFTWHDLRHCHASWLRQSGVAIEVVQRSLGHASITMTMRYAHVDDREVREALAKLPSFATFS